MSHQRAVCVVTGSRAEYGLLRWVMHEINARLALRLQLVVTGTHLSPAFGATEREIIDDGFSIDRRVEIVLSSDSAVGVAKSHALAVSGIAEALADLRPEMVVILGDRYEAHAAAVAALICRIPVAHIHGGEVTTGSIDDQFRHSITKMSQLHLVAHEDYRRRVIQMGEHPDRVHVVGGLGFESTRRVSLLTRNEVEARLGMPLQERNLLVVFHPETATVDNGLAALKVLCTELARFEECGFVVSLPNADAGADPLRRHLLDFAANQKYAVTLNSMGQELYLSCLSHMSGIVGNSSSGLLEAPALGVPTLDIGFRQLGRRRVASVLHTVATPSAVRETLTELLSISHKAITVETQRELDALPTSQLICDALEAPQSSSWTPKQFVDLPLGA